MGMSRQRAEGAGRAAELNAAIRMASSRPKEKSFIFENGGVDGARTRDLRRDRPAF